MLHRHFHLTPHKLRRLPYTLALIKIFKQKLKKSANFSKNSPLYIVGGKIMSLGLKTTVAEKPLPLDENLVRKLLKLILIVILLVALLGN